MRIRQAFAMVSVVGVLLMAGGCLSGWERASFRRDVELLFTIPAEAGLAAKATNGSVAMREGGSDEVRVVAHIRATSQERADAVRIIALETSDWLEIIAEWPEVRRGNEGVSFEIEAPGGRPVRARTSNGNVALVGFSGGASLDTSNGNVSVESHEGPIEIDTSNGNVVVHGASGSVMADTSNASITVSLTDDSRGPLTLDTSNGNVSLIVGPGFAGEIHADTSNGSVKIHDSGAGAVTELIRNDRTNKVVRIGEGGEASVIDTSNGSVDIEVRG